MEFMILLEEVEFCQTYQFLYFAGFFMGLRKKEQIHKHNERKKTERKT